MRKIKSFLRIALVLVALVISLSLVRSMLKITGANTKITDEETKLSDLRKENDELNQKLKAINSSQFIESQARDKLGLAKKGEIVVVLPDENTLKSLAPKEETKTYTLPDPNWKLWAKLFL